MDTGASFDPDHVRPELQDSFGETLTGAPRLRPWELAYLAFRWHVRRHGAPPNPHGLQAKGEPWRPAATPDEAFAALARLLLAGGLPAPVWRAGFAALERALGGVTIERFAAIGEDDLATLLAAPGVLRNPRKLWAVAENARALHRLFDDLGGLAGACAYLEAQPALLAMAELHERLVRVGPIVAARWMHALGIDCPVPHPAVRRILHRLGLRFGATGALAGHVQALRSVARLEEGPLPMATASALLYRTASGAGLPEALCGAVPRCGHCPAAVHCEAHRFGRLDRESGESPGRPEPLGASSGAQA